MSFDTDTFLVREHVGMLKLHEAYDILTPEGTTIATAVERANALRQFLKLVVNKNMLPFKVEIVNPDQSVMVTIQRPFTFLRSKVSVFDGNMKRIGYFKQRFLSLGGAFDIYDENDQEVALLKGDWKGWNFKFTDKSGQELGTVSRQWGGMAKELFTSADNYVVHLERSKLKDAEDLLLLLASAICIDMVLKETGN
jgi:uncharacterized protein YxjI